MSTVLSKGMENVVAAETAIASIDGKAGELRYYGYSVGELADRCSFEDVAYLLWHGELPNEAESDALARELGQIRVKRSDLSRALDMVPLTAHPLDVLRFAVSLDALSHPLAWDNSPDANLQKAIQFTAWFPAVIAAYHRMRRGLSPIPPTGERNTASEFLYMLTGFEPSAVAAKTLDTSLVLHAEHELNASTFAARVTTATQSNLHAAVASALGTLAGPRHGGASERIIHMLETIGAPERADEYVAGILSRRERVMGFGHRVYRTADPRSKNLREMAGALLADTPRSDWMLILQHLAEIMVREKGLYPNVDLYAAVVNHELGIDPAFYTSIFACSRITGWTAHAVEQLGGRIIRPAAQYTGPAPRPLPRHVRV